jgi:hypothetical protein
MIILFDLLFAIASVLLIGFIITQVIIPIATGRPLFPFFSKETLYKAEGEALRQTLHEQELLEENARLAILAKEKADAVSEAIEKYAATPTKVAPAKSNAPRKQKPKATTPPVVQANPTKVDRSAPPVAKPKKPRVRKPKAPTTPAV